MYILYIDLYIIYIIYKYIENNFTQCTYMYYVNTNFYFGCD